MQQILHHVKDKRCGCALMLGTRVLMPDETWGGLGKPDVLHLMLHQKHNDDFRRLQDAVMKGDFAGVQRILEGDQYPDGVDAAEAPLGIAAEAGTIEIVRSLLSFHADVTLRDRSGRSALRKACARNFQDVMVCLLQAGADAAADLFHMMAAREFAEANRLLDVCKALSIPVDLDRQDDETGCTSLGMAARHGNKLAVAHLLKLGADGNRFSRDGCPPMQHAASAGHWEVVHFLVISKANPELAQNFSGNSLLQQAILHEKPEMLFFLLEAHTWTDIRALVNQRSNSGATVLQLAADKGLASAVRALLAVRAQVDLRGESNRTPLFTASQQGHLPVAEALLRARASVHLRDDTQSMLQAAAGRDHSEMVRLLIKERASPNSFDSEGTSILQTVAGKGNLVLLEVLLSLGADPSDQNQHKDSILHWIGRTEHWRTSSSRGEVMQCLLAKPRYLDLNKKNASDRTALLEAALAGQADVVGCLLEARADPCVQGHMGRTPLLAAAREGHAEIVRLLLAHGASPNQKDSRGRTALSACLQEKHPAVHCLLQFAQRADGA